MLLNKLIRVSYKTALLNFLLVGLLGMFMRWIQWAGTDNLNFKFLLHAHSHFAMGGWMFTALFAAILHAYRPFLQHQVKSYTRIFLVCQIGCFGMLLSFPFIGYAPLSILLSEMYVLATYWFVYRIWKDVPAGSFSVKWLRMSLVFLVVSSLGPYTVGPMMVNHLAGSVWYYDAIYFYLHFQYNGWFTFAAFALLFRYVEEQNISLDVLNAQRGYWLMTMACFVTFFLSVLWSNPGWWFNAVGAVGAVLQLLGVFYLSRLLNLQLLYRLCSFPLVKTLLVFSAIAFIIKVVLQAAGAFSGVALAAYHYRDFIIAYLHCVLLGFLSTFLMAYFLQAGMLTVTKITKAAVFLFLFGFVTTELLMVLNAIMQWASCPALPGFRILLISFTALLPLSLLIIYLKHFWSVHSPLAANAQNVSV